MKMGVSRMVGWKKGKYRKIDENPIEMDDHFRNPPYKCMISQEFGKDDNSNHHNDSSNNNKCILEWEYVILWRPKVPKSLTKSLQVHPMLALVLQKDLLQLSVDMSQKNKRLPSFQLKEGINKKASPIPKSSEPCIMFDMYCKVW